jgi:hypothetical protein
VVSEKKMTNQKQELPVAAMFVNGWEEMGILYRGPPIDDTYQELVHLAKQFQRRRFLRNQPIRNKNCLWWPMSYNQCFDVNSERKKVI